MNVPSPHREIAASKFPAIVLCGGGSERMGRDKNWLQWGEGTFLSQIVSTVAQVCSPIVLVRHNHSQTIPPLQHFEDIYIIEDSAAPESSPADRKTPGPVPAVLAGLNYLAGLKIELAEDTPVFLTANDSPMLRAELIQSLHRDWTETHLTGSRITGAPMTGPNLTGAHLTGGQSASDSTGVLSASPPSPMALIPMVDQRLQFLCSIISPRLRNPLEEYLAGGRRSLKGVFKQVAIRQLQAEDLKTSDPELLSFRNVNTPEQYSAALQTYQRLNHPQP